MGIFSKKIKAKPVVETQGLRIEYDPEDEIWQFTHNGADFVAYGTAFVVPSLERLSTIQADIDRLRAEMTRRLAEGWKDSKDVKTNDGESYLVNLTDLHSQGSFEVSWSGGESWGDMGIDFTISNHEITDESWGD
jgi:hypothetical protein